MGTKFCNLNLKGTGLTLPSKPKIAVFACAPGWMTVTSPAFQWGTTEHYAKAWSNELGCSILCTEYFDDDFVSFTLYEHGKRIARHVPATYEDIRRSAGNPDRFLAALDMDPLDTPLLEKIFAVKDPEQAVCLMESFFGCPIWGIDEDCPPVSAPDPNVARSFMGESCPVRYSAEKRKVRTDIPPYLGGEHEKPPCRPEKEFSEDTVFCWGGDLKQILKMLRRHIQRIQNDLDEAEHFEWETHCRENAWLYNLIGQFSGDNELDEDAMERLREAAEDRMAEQAAYDRKMLEQLHFRVFQHGDLIVLKGVPICNVDVDLPDLSRDYRCLTAVTRVRTGSDGEYLQFDCGFAYGKKLLCFGRRGEYPRVMPEFTLESPWINLKSGELVAAFENPAGWDAVQAVGSLLGASLLPTVPGAEWECIEDTPHLKVYRK